MVEKIHQNLKNVPVIPTVTMKFMLFQPLQGLGAPYWNQMLMVLVFGLTSEEQLREDFIKATLQSIAYQVRDIIDNDASGMLRQLSKS